MAPFTCACAAAAAVRVETVSRVLASAGVVLTLPYTLPAIACFVACLATETSVTDLRSNHVQRTVPRIG